MQIAFHPPDPIRDDAVGPPGDVAAPTVRGHGNLDAAFDRFVVRLRARLAVGAATYGDTSFRRPAADLVDEVQQELEDVCGWSLILWIRLEGLRERVNAIVSKEEM